ncbi:MAG TPA: acyl carrier protein [Labilithrix sp.]|jgi:acyl carrier protein|nr:acyl carrier protein [Labilithrix sp.]
MTTVSRDEILEHVRRAMEDLFEIDAARVQLDTKVVEDLDLDSIDAIELAVRMETLTGQRLNPESFREMRTISDVVEILHRLLSQAPVSEAS